MVQQERSTKTTRKQFRQSTHSNGSKIIGSRAVQDHSVLNDLQEGHSFKYGLEKYIRGLDDLGAIVNTAILPAGRL